MIPGVKLTDSGITLRQLIDEHCGGMQDGHTLAAYLPGGASGGILPASMDDIPLDFGTLEQYGCFIGSAAVVVLSDKDDLRAAALNLMRFFEDESCGQCTPCRNGTQKARMLMEAPHWDGPLLGELAAVMARRVDLRAGAGGVQPARVPAQILPGGRVVISFELDGATVEAADGETIWEVAKRLGTAIPHLCHADRPGYRADGNCRACMVEIDGERVLAASCKRRPAEGMKVRVASPRAEASRKMVMELLVADQPARATSHDPQSAFWAWADRTGVTEQPVPGRDPLEAGQQPSGDARQPR